MIRSRSRWRSATRASCGRERRAAAMPCATRSPRSTSFLPISFRATRAAQALVDTVHDPANRCEILTNSLAANDVAAVHGGYSRYRNEAAQGRRATLGTETAHGSHHRQSSLFGSSGASLHTKALSIDQKTLFVGSYNLDPRSTWLNCEQGVLVENAVLTAQFRRFSRRRPPARARGASRCEDGRACAGPTTTACPARSPQRPRSRSACKPGSRGF